MSVDHYENFPVASLLLPARLRYPVTQIYRFARAADDLADEGNLTPACRLNELAEFDRELVRIAKNEPPGSLLFAELGPVIREHALPLQLFHDLLSAFAQDVVKKSYANFHDLLDYCRRSANPVGRLLLKLYEADTPQNHLWSDEICTSLQIINFLQDIKIDYGIGRIYMPEDEMARFGVTSAQIAAADTGGAWRTFMHFQIDRARKMLWNGAPLGRTLRGRIGLEMRMIVAGGDRILSKIEAAQCDVFAHRPTLRSYDWMLMLMRTLAVR